MAQVIQLAKLYRWRTAHFRSVRVQRKNGSTYWQTPVQGDGIGWPDLVLVRERIVFAELKAEDGEASDEQKEWLAALREAGAEVYLWKPSDWREIERVLTTTH